MSMKKPTGADAPQSPQSYIDDQTAQPNDSDATDPPDVKQPPDASKDPSVSPSAVLPLVALALMLVILAPPAAKLVRRRRRRSARRTSRAVAGAWQELLDLAVDAGIAADPRSRRRDQARELGVDPGLAASADRLVFAPAPPSAAEVAEFWRAADVARKGLRGRLGVVRRVRAVWSPVSLLASTRKDDPDRGARTWRLRLSRAGA